MYTGLAWLSHEAAHIGHSIFDIPLLTDNDPINHNILNFVEDARIDSLNFQRLPYIKSFYEEMYTFLDQSGKLTTKAKDSSVESKVLADTIMDIEGFPQFKSGNATITQFIIKTNLKGKFWDFHNILNTLERETRAKNKNLGPVYNAGRAKLKEIRDLISMFKQQHGQQFQSGGQGQAGKGQGGKGGGSGSGALDVAQNGITGGVATAILEDCDPATAFSGPTIAPAALEERTKQGFQDLLCLKERKIVDDGAIIDTDELTAFFTGDIETLFKQDEHVKVKRSKIIMIMDASGSMSANLIDGTRRADTLAKTAQSISDILDETIELEGLDIDYLVRAFTDDYHILPKQNWQQHYLARANQGGGTDLLKAFSQAQDELLADQSITGRRMIVCLTDGEVSSSELDEMRRRIMAHNADVRAMIIGTGAEPNSVFIRTITGHNIVSKDIADVVLMEAICEMLQD